MHRFAFLLLLIPASCVAGSEPAPVPAPKFEGMQHVADPGLDHVIRASPRIWSGAAPAGEATFAALAARGIRTIVNVDGARPDVEGAARHGLRYVHIPIGYDGVPAEAALQITRVLRETEGAIYFHCHHGRHRGPAAAAIAMRLETGCSADEALALMRLAETDPQYDGLWRDVANFREPAPDAALPALYEVAPVGDFVAAMAKLDRDWDRVKLVKAAGWGVPPEHPDLVPAKEARILAETLDGLAPLARAEIATQEDFRRWMAGSQADARGLVEALERGDANEAHSRFDSLRKNCLSCHDVYRN